MNPAEVAQQNAVQIQRSYYADTANRYDSMHVHQDDEHSIALRFMISFLQQLGVKSILDIGCGTGRGLLTLNRAMPDIDAIGVEPSAELRQIGYANGLSQTQLIDGDAMNNSLGDGLRRRLDWTKRPRSVLVYLPYSSWQRGETI